MVPVQTKYKEIKNDFPTYGKSFLLSCAKQNVLFLQRARMQKLINGSMQNVSRSGEKGGPPAVGWWWKVDSSMLEYRKGCKCSESFFSCRRYASAQPSHRPELYAWWTGLQSRGPTNDGGK